MEKEDKTLAVKYFKPSESGVNLSLDLSKLSEKEKQEFKDLNLSLKNYATKEMVNNKVTQVPGKGLSTNDYTNQDKQKVNSIPDDAVYTDTKYNAGNGLELVEGTFNVDNTIARREDIPDGADLSEYAKLSELNKKVDKVDGKTLSTNDYTTADKNKLSAIPSNPKYTDTTYQAGSGLTLSSDNTFSINDTIARKSDIPDIGKIDLSSYATTEFVNDKLENKVDKVQGKKLSTNDYTNTDKIKVNNIPKSGAKYTDTTYSAGNGLALSNNTFTVDNTIARKTDLDNITLSSEQMKKLKGEPGARGPQGPQGPQGEPASLSDLSSKKEEILETLLSTGDDQVTFTIGQFDLLFKGDGYNKISITKTSGHTSSRIGIVTLDFERKTTTWL